jgi:hypothetical protein
MNETPKSDRRDFRNSADTLHALSPIIRSAVGVVRESAGLLHNVAALGFALVFEAEKVPPRRPRAPPSNVIPFRTNRPLKQKEMNRSRM